MVVIYLFIQAWFFGVIALVAGRYIGPGVVRFPSKKGRVLLLYLMVWGLTFLGQIVFGYLGILMQWSEAAQAGFAEFLLPIAAAAYFARHMLLLYMQRERSG